MNADESTDVRETIPAIAADTKLLTRYLAAGLDKLFAGITGIVFYGLAGSLWPREGRPEYQSYLIAMGCYLLFFVLCEATTGRTPGKFFSGLIVVSRSGNRCSATQALVRNLLRVVDEFPLGILLFLLGVTPAGFFILISGHRQRLGDLIAGTYVIDVIDAKRFLRTTQQVASQSSV